MDHLVDMERPVNSVVRFPNQRMRIMQAIAELADVDAHVPDWFRARGPLQYALDLLYNEIGGFDNLEALAPGDEYFSGREFDAVCRLATAFSALIDSTPGGLYWTTFAAQSPLWPTIAPLAADVVVRMTLNWGFEEPAGITESTPDD